MRKETSLDRIVLRAVRWIMGNSNWQADRFAQTLQVVFENVLAGGIAAAAHGAARVTRDFDITPEWESENLQRLSAALASMEAKLRVPGSSPDSRELVDYPLSGAGLRSFEVSTWRTKHGDLDIVQGTPKESGGLADYDELSRRANDVEAYGLTISIASLDDIIESKRVLKREPDLAALPELYSLRDATNPDSGIDK